MAGQGVRGGDTLLGCEAARGPWVSGGVWLVPPTMTVLVDGGGGCGVVS